MWQVQPAGTHVSRVFVSLCQVYYRANYGFTRVCLCLYVCIYTHVCAYVCTHTRTSLLNLKRGGLMRHGCNANDLELSRSFIRERRSMQPRSENYLSVKRFINKRQIAIDRVICRCAVHFRKIVYESPTEIFVIGKRQYLRSIQWNKLHIGFYEFYSLFQ